MRDGGGCTVAGDDRQGLTSDRAWLFTYGEPSQAQMILGRVQSFSLTKVVVIQTLVIRTRWLSLKQRPGESPPSGPTSTHLSTVTRDP